MTKKRKMRKTKSVKRKTHSSIIIAFFLITGRLFFWIIKQIYFLTQKNALLVFGFLIFIISFGFISFNALFSQIRTYQGIFSQIKITSALSIGQNSDLSPKEAKSHADASPIPLPSLNDIRTNSSTEFLSESMLEMQKKLAKLGFYDGPLDGRDGPKTRRAIALWKKQTADKNTISPNPATDEIAILIKRSEIEMEKELSYSKADILKSPLPAKNIVRVQEALRAFGNQEVAITGVEDQKTIDALKQFQEMFNLPITGKIDQVILKKMREIRLLN
ncbi:peptidoglycan-binding domain-containing protein [Bartonella sp. B17]